MKTIVESISIDFYGRDYRLRKKHPITKFWSRLSFTKKGSSESPPEADAFLDITNVGSSNLFVILTALYSILWNGLISRNNIALHWNFVLSWCGECIFEGEWRQPAVGRRENQSPVQNLQIHRSQNNTDSISVCPAWAKEYYIDAGVFFAVDCVGALGVIQWVGHFGDWYWRILVRPEGASDLLQVAEPLNYTHYFFTFCRLSTFSRAKSPIIFQSPKIILRWDLSEKNNKFWPHSSE